MHVRIGYPDVAAEKLILHLARDQAHALLERQQRAVKLISQEQVFQAQRQVLELYLAPQLEEYLVQLVLATRDPAPYGQDLARWVSFGASPRGTIALDRCARAHAWLTGRDYVSPEDIHAIAHDTLRHRVLLSFEAEADGVGVDFFINELLQRVPLP
jgi:MoxR-like ATPase